MKIIIYCDKKKEFRWKAVNRGRIMADSGEGYKRRAACERAIESIRKGFPVAVIIDETPNAGR